MTVFDDATEAWWAGAGDWWLSWWAKPDDANWLEEKPGGDAAGKTCHSVRAVTPIDAEAFWKA